MRSLAAFLVFCIVLSGCGSTDKPDVSGVNVGKVHIERFDTAFFHLDSNNSVAGLRQLDQHYPYFTPDFVGNILGAGALLLVKSCIALMVALVAIAAGILLAMINAMTGHR